MAVCDVDSCLHSEDSPGEEAHSLDALFSDHLRSECVLTAALHSKLFHFFLCGLFVQQHQCFIMMFSS